MGFLSTLTAAVSLYSGLAWAETTLQETIYGAFLYTYYGDRTPIVEANPTLTPLGAQQLYTAGSNFRNRYVYPTSSSDSSTTVQGISAYELDNEQVSVLTYYEQYCVASAQAFMQGLYPPVEGSVNYTSLEADSTLANGSTVDYPLGGYQYSQLYTAADVDPNSIWVGGNVNCPTYISSMSDYFASTQYEDLEQATYSFYDSLYPVLAGVFSNASIGYFDAYYIYDYLNYGVTYNSTIADAVSTEDLLQARTLADQWMYAMTANTTSTSGTDEDIRTIAGRTFASRLATDMYTNMDTQGEQNKLSLMFGSYEPMMSFAELAGLMEEQTSQFYGQPQFGSSMIFELYALEANESTSYPEVNDLMVRFLFQNGSDGDLVQFALFGNDPSELAMSFADFLAGVESFMTSGIESWCEVCDSGSVFCAAYEDGTTSSGSDSSTGSSESGSDNGSRMNPAVAGVIGAVVTLAVVGMIVFLGMFFGGYRVYRQHTNIRSELGGFKGEKLASDPDLTVGKTGVGATVISGDENIPKGHERIGSWEMGQPKPKEHQLQGGPSTGRPSFDEDDLHVTPFADPVKADDKV